MFKKKCFLLISLLVFVCSNTAFSSELQNEWIQSSSDANLSLEWNLEGLEFSPIITKAKNNFWVPTPEKPTTVTVNLKIPTNIFSDVSYNVPTYVENENGEFELESKLSSPLDDEIIQVNIILNHTILFSESISESTMRTNGDIYSISDTFLALNNEWRLDNDSPFSSKNLSFTQNIQISISRSGYGDYNNSAQLNVSCLLTPKTDPWELGYYDNTSFIPYPDYREIPLDNFVVIPAGIGFLSADIAYDNITLSKKDGPSIPIKKALSGSMIKITPIKALEYDTEYELTMPQNSVSGIEFIHSALNKNGVVPTTTINFVTRSVIKTSYILGYDLPMSDEKAVPLRLNFESQFKDIKIAKITLESTSQFKNSLFSVIENNEIVNKPSVTYKDVTKADFDFNKIDLSLWQRQFDSDGHNGDNAGYYYKPYYENLVASVVIIKNNVSKTIKIPIQIKADALYTLYVMDQGLADNGKGQVLLGDKPLETKAPYKVLEPTKVITLPFSSRILVKFIDGTVGCIKMDTDMARELVTIKPTAMKLEPMANETEFKNENAWSAKFHGILENELTNSLIDKTVNFIFKNPKIASPVGFVVGIFASPDQLGGSILSTRIRSNVGFSMNEKKGIIFSNFEGSPEIILGNQENILMPVGQQLLQDSTNTISGDFTQINKDSRIYKLSDQIISDLKIIDQPSYIYHCDNGLIIESFSRYWWDDEKLEDLYQELLCNEHGNEIKALKTVKIYPKEGLFHEQGRAAGYYLSSKREIHLNFGDANTTIDSMARTLSHEYGHHYTLYNSAKNEKVKLGESNIAKTPYVIARNLSKNTYVKNNYENGHAWNVLELAAEDYVQILGSEKANNFRNQQIQENPIITIASDVPKLANYFRKLGNLPVKTETAFEKLVLKVKVVDGDEDYNQKHLHFYWNSILIDDSVSYMLVKVKENKIYINRTIGVVEGSTLANLKLDDHSNIVLGESTYVLYARDKTRDTISSKPVIIIVEDLGKQNWNVKIK